MPDLIKILPPHVANQIAAGEAVQRPASVVKELMENSVDAGSTSVTVVIHEGGGSLIQVTDNGTGMSAVDAENAFVRHATSKIKTAEDLFDLHTFGFRGEALASIAAVAEVILRTRRADDDLGTEIAISGGSAPGISRVACAQGTTITVRNLFYNIPARRKFLKSAAYETKLIIAEFQRVALVNPDIAFTFVINGEKPMFSLMPGNLHQRIAALTSKGMGDKLLPVDAETPVVRLSGYIGTPKTARKSCTETFFFVNGRYIRSPYLHKAVLGGYGKLIAPDTNPAYFIYIEVDPQRLDVNIHPTKTEIKFEDDHVIWQIVNSAVRETLGKYNVVPTIDFDNQVQLDIPVYRKTPAKEIKQPSYTASEDYNPFKSYDREEWENRSSGQLSKPWVSDPEKAPFTEMLPDGLVESLNKPGKDNSDASVHYKSPYKHQDFDLPSGKTRNKTGISSSADTISRTSYEPIQTTIQDGAQSMDSTIVYDGKYIITATIDGIVIINYQRALQRIIYESTLDKIGRGQVVSQRQLHPVKIELSKSDHRLILNYPEELSAIGFEISDMGGTDIAVYGVPAELSGKIDPEEAIDCLVGEIKEFGTLSTKNRTEHLAKILSRIGRKTSKHTLSQAEASQVVNRLLAAREPNYTPDSLPVIEIISRAELEKRFKK